jgi:hypothetical protein
MMISCHKGLAPISFPAGWLAGFDVSSSFASVKDEGRIRFPNGRAFGVAVHHNGPDVSPVVRELDPCEIAETEWGPLCEPWETSRTAQIFGHGKVTRLF